MANDHRTRPDLKAVAEIGRRELVGRELAHVASLLLLKFSVKVVRHKYWISCCGGLWKRNRSRIPPPGFGHVEVRGTSFRRPRKVGSLGCGTARVGQPPKVKKGVYCRVWI